MRTALLAAVGCGLTLLGVARPAAAGTIAVSATLHTPSPTQIVTVTYNGQTAQTYAGLIQWTVNSTTPAGIPAGTPFGTFCCDLGHDISVGSSYSYDLVDGRTASNLAVLGGFAALPASQSSAAITSVERLYAADYATATVAGHNDQAAAFQLTVWKLVYGTNVSFTGLSTAVQNLVTGYTADANSYASAMTLFGLQSAGTSPAAQDQLVVIPGVTPASAPVATPAPAAAAGGSVLLAGLAVATGLSRRRPALA